MISKKCVVLCDGCSGPVFVQILVKCSEEDFMLGRHYEAAELAAKDANYDTPMIAFDEHDEAGMTLCPVMSWKHADIIRTDCSACVS